MAIRLAQGCSAPGCVPAARHRATTEQSDTAIQNVRHEFGKKPHDWIWSELPRVRENDWVLCLYATGRQLRWIHWLFADRVLAVPKSDRNFDPESPFEVIQIHSPKQYPPPPFSIDQRFREAAKHVLASNDFYITATPRALGTATVRALYSAMR